MESQVNSAQNRARTLATQVESLARYLASKAQAFEEADRQGAAELDVIIRKHPMPTPTPTPAPIEEAEEIGTISLENALRALDDLLKPIDWVGKSEKATEQFHETFKQIGRVLNSLTGTRGHIKMFDELAGFLSGTTKLCPQQMICYS